MRARSITSLRYWGLWISTTDMIDSLIDRFLNYREIARNNSAHTIKAFAADLTQFAEFLETRNASDLSLVDLKLLRAFFASLLGEKYSRATIARKQSSLRALFQWARREGLIKSDPARGLISPRQNRSLPK